MKLFVPVFILVIVLVLVAYQLGERAYALPLILEVWIVELYPSAILTLVLAMQVSLLAFRAALYLWKALRGGLL